MKKLSVLLSTLLVGGILVFVSCSKTGAAGPAGANGAAGNTGASGPILTGSIAGTIVLSNQYGAAVTTNLQLANIVLKNSTTGATVDSVYANALGHYTIPNVQTGIYTMLCYYPGYGLNEHQNVAFTGGGTDSINNKLAQIPNFNVTTANDSIGTKHDGVSTVYIYGNIAADAGGARTIIVFTGSTSTASASPSTYSFVTSKLVPADSSTYTISIPANTFYSNGFAYGSVAYFAVYGASNNYADGDYTNYADGQLVYTAISASAVAAPTVTLP
jgi:hypothetical protein